MCGSPGGRTCSVQILMGHTECVFDVAWGNSNPGFLVTASHDRAPGLRPFRGGARCCRGDRWRGSERAGGVRGHPVPSRLSCYRTQFRVFWKAFQDRGRGMFRPPYPEADRLPMRYVEVLVRR